MEEVKQELNIGWEAARQLKGLITAKEELKHSNNYDEALISMKHHSALILQTFDNAISILKTGQPMATDPIRPRSNNRNSKPQETNISTTATTDQDGYSWRKYGQKPIVNTKHPREYYRCGYRDQGCQATKQVQIISENPTEYKITYQRKHTCKGLPSNAPHFDALDLIEADSPNMLSFAFSTKPSVSKRGLTSCRQNASPDESNAKVKQPDETISKVEQSMPHDDHLGLGTSVIHNTITNSQYGSLLSNTCGNSDVGIHTPASEEIDFTRQHLTSVELNGGSTSPRWCGPMASPDRVDVDYGYLVGDYAELDGGFEDLQLWD